MLEGCTRQETDGAMGGGRRRIRGDAGENGRVEAGPREMWLHNTERMITREYEYGRISMGELIRGESVKMGDCSPTAAGEFYFSRFIFLPVFFK